MPLAVLPKRDENASLWEKIRVSAGLVLAGVAAPLVVTPITSMPLSAALMVVLPSVGGAAFALRRSIKGAERLTYYLTRQGLTIERYRGALDIPLERIAYLQAVPLDGVRVPNGFPGYHVGKAKVPALGKHVMIIASSLRGEGLLIGYRQGHKAKIHGLVITPEVPEAIKSALEG